MELEKIFNKIDDHLLEAWNSDNEYNIDCIKDYLNELKEAINYTRCCEELKEDKEYTFTLDISNQKKTEELSKQLKELLAKPSKIYFIDKEGNKINF
jgi:hypothetical protein